MDRKNVDGGFIIEQEHLEGRCYVLTGPWTARCADAYHREGARFIRLNRTLGARFEDLEFLKELTDLRGVEIYDPTVTMKQLAPLLDLHALELIGLQCKFKDIDFAARFPDLKPASFHWKPGCESVFGCVHLRYLFVEGYPGDDLKWLSPLSSLVRLHVNSKALVSAQGCAELARLEHLTFAHCSALLDVEAASRCTALQVLELYQCKKVTRLPSFSAGCGLRRLTIENAGTIESINPIAGCPALEEVFLPGTKIGDGDVSVLLSLPKLKRVAFPRSKAYSHSMDEVNAALAARR